VDMQSLQMDLRKCLNRAHGTNTPIYDSRYIKGEDGLARTEVLLLFNCGDESRRLTRKSHYRAIV
jgi:hypothetical protein